MKPNVFLYLFFLLSRFMAHTLSVILGKLFLEKTPLNLGLLLKQIVIAMLLTEWSGTKNSLFIYLLPALPTPLPLIPLTTEEINSCTIEAAKGDNKAPRNQSS